MMVITMWRCGLVKQSLNSAAKRWCSVLSHISTVVMCTISCCMFKEFSEKQPFILASRCTLLSCTWPYLKLTCLIWNQPNIVLMKAAQTRQTLPNQNCETRQMLSICWSMQLETIDFFTMALIKTAQTPQILFVFYCYPIYFDIFLSMRGLFLSTSLLL